MKITVSSSDRPGDANISPVACDRGRVLIAEDESTIADLFAIILANSFPSLEVDKVEDGEEALRLFAEHHHALVIMDVNMPRMSGHIVYRKMEALCTGKIWETPSVLFCTGQMHHQDVHAIIAGDSRHGMLIKPVQPNQLIDFVRSRLNHSGAPDPG